MEIVLKRVYEPHEASDGFRALVDRLWPRGLSKEKAALDAWDKELAPSSELRTWFNHDPAKWAEFRQRYLEELRGNAPAVEAFKGKLRGSKRVTLLYGARDEEHNQAVVLREFLQAPAHGA